MKFKFQFENVLKHRKTLEDIAQRDFEEAQSIYLGEKRNLEHLHQEVSEARRVAYERQKRGGNLATSALTQVHEFLKLQDVRIERQSQKVQECEKRVEELREILRQKAIDYKIIESLKDRRRQEYRIEKNKTEQKRSDNLTTMRHLGNLARMKEK